MAKTPPVECLVGSPYGIDCDRVAGRDVDGCGASGVVCHVDGCGEPGCGRVEVSGGGGASWRIDGGMMDKDGVVGSAGGSWHGGGGVRGAVWVRLDARGWWFGRHGGFSGGMRYAHAAYHVVSGGCGGIVGGFECGPRFDDTAGGACESMCIAVIVILGYPAHVVGLGLLVLDSTSPFFDSTFRLLFDLWYPLTSLLFGLVLCCGRVVRRFINNWCGGGFSGYGDHWDIGEQCGVRDGRRGLVG